MPVAELYEKLMALHTRDGGLVMPNAWDGLSALTLADAGFEAIATSSAALAATTSRTVTETRLKTSRRTSSLAWPVSGSRTPWAIPINLQKAGVKRISVGPSLYIHAMGALEQATKALVAGDLASAPAGINFGRISELLARGKNWPKPYEPPLLTY
jgi:2-methylisocitrate lyase-like PEP mutase family enzyme